MLIGFIAAIISNLAIHLLNKTEIDDTLNVIPSHGVGGLVGMYLTGVFASEVFLIYGETSTFFFHLLGLLIVAVFSFGGSYLCYIFVDKVLTLTVKEDQEERGLDLSQHSERVE